MNGSLGVAGSATFSDLINSPTAFQVQNAAGATILSTDTTANQVNLSGNLNLNQVSAPSAAPTVAVNTTSGNLDSTYYYVYSYVTPSGITNYSPVSSSVTPVNQQVNVTVTASTNPLVTGINIYRTKAGETSSGPFYLVNSSPLSNTTQTYTDNIADASLGAAASNTNQTASLQENGQRILNVSSTSYNISLGNSLDSNSTGMNNIALGNLALFSNSTGSENTALGTWSMLNNTTGASNIAIGPFAMDNNISGNNNLALGELSLAGNTTGSNNIGLGYQAGYTSNSANANTTGSNNTFIGYNSGPGVASSSSLQNATSIGAYSTVDTSNSLVLGSISGVNGATSSTNVGIGIASPTSTLDVLGNATIRSSANSLA